MTSSGLLIAALLAGAPATAIDFDTQIIPVLTRAGCNAGSCHGAAAGRGGFRLSLLGGDPVADHDAIVQELEGRRVNLVKPGISLLLAKPTGNMAHKGGLRLEDGGSGAKRIEEWIAAGARRSGTRRLTHFEIRPASQTMAKVGSVVALKGIARFNDGKPVEVTDSTVFTASDPAAVEVDDQGQATVRRRGQHVVVARFLDRVVPVLLTVPMSDRLVDHGNQPRASFIDDEVYETLTVLRLPVAPRADDATFLRRVHLDLTGQLPTRDQVVGYLKDTSTDKKTKLIDRLLRSDAYVDYWTHRFATLFRIRSQPNDPVGAATFHRWVREQIHASTPLHRVARSLLTAVGDSHVIGPANFARVAADARGQAELVSQVFLGVRLQCANCHNHPLDRWTQDDYHGLAGVFARLDRGRHVKVAARGAVTHPRTGEPAVPRIPGVRFLDPDKDGREAFADWLTARDNPYFARAAVNRLWKAMFGRGLVEPADDLRDTNPATHPRLLIRLAADFVKHDHDIRHTLRLIASSEAYARGPLSGATDSVSKAEDRFYSRAYRRPLLPEVLADALADVTGVADRYGDLPLGTRAVALIDPQTPAPSLDILGRCNRQAACEADLQAGGGLPGRLHRLNGELINRKVAAKEGLLHRLIDKGASNDEILREFYLRACSRYPTSAERKFWAKQWANVDGEERVKLLEDIVWSVLNSVEFNSNQ